MGFFELEADHGCGNCKRGAVCKTKNIPIGGQGEKKIAVIVEQPTKAEDEAGQMSFGPGDAIYAGILKSEGIYPEKDCWKIAAIRCAGTKPKAAEIKACREHLKKTLKKLKPERILVFGSTAFNTLLGDVISTTGYQKYVGALIPDKNYRTTIAPLYSSKYIRANCKEMTDTTPLFRVFRQQVKAAVTETPPPAPKFKGFHPQLENLKKITSGYWAFDIETTGIKPYAEGHKIVCFSFSDGKNTIALPYTEDLKPELERIFTSPEIKLIAHNLKFEDLWLREILGIQITNWYWDTMLAVHCIDNQSGITGLKYQTYVNFGVGGYEKEVEGFLKSGEKSGNARNAIEAAPMDRLLWYCAQDAFYTAHLFYRQYKIVPPGFFFFLEGAKEISRIESNGICLDMPRIKKKRTELRKRVAEYKEKISADPDVKKWEGLEGKDFNPNSPLQMKSFFKMVGETFWKQTEKGGDSTDREALAGFKHPVAKLIIEMRENEKLEGTFLAGLEDEQVDGVLHPTFLLHVAASYRSSSASPNFQNYPKRDKRAQRIVRANFVPRKDRLLLEVDYSGVEVRVGACYHKDKKMIEYIQDPNTDMHRDVAAQILDVKPEAVEKEWRQWAKGGFVFPAFYGSWYKQMAENLWRDCPRSAMKALKATGIQTFPVFQKHIQEIENHFWNTRFKQYGAWKKAQWKKYQETGVVQSHTGFRYTGVMDRKIVSNYPIQGSAFHCLLWSLIQMNRWLRETGKETLIVSQIHDSIILDVKKEELQEVKTQLRKTMCADLEKQWPWLVVPLDIDADASEKNWYEMQPEKI